MLAEHQKLLRERAEAAAAAEVTWTKQNAQARRDDLVAVTALNIAAAEMNLARLSLARAVKFISEYEERADALEKWTLRADKT
jgi:DNA polymerase IIIc chi subunit